MIIMIFMIMIMMKMIISSIVQMQKKNAIAILLRTQTNIFFL